MLRPRQGSRVVLIARATVAAMLIVGVVACGDSAESGPESSDETSGVARAKGKAFSKGKAPRAGFGRGGGGADPAVPVIVGDVGVETMQAFLDASSTFEAEASVAVVSQATGVVAELAAEEGDIVTRGDVLARLAYEDLELAEARARSELDRLENNFARAEKLSRESFISDEEFQMIRFDLARAEIDWKSARLELDRTRVTAPISGTVTERLINVGQLVSENEPVYRIVDFDSLVAPVFVPEKYLPDLHVGQSALITTRRAEGAPIEGRVKRISPVVDSQSGTVRVLVDLPSDRALRPGMFADVQLVLDLHEDVVVVPKKALVYEDELPHVFVVEAGQATKRSITLGYQDAGRAEVTEGLQPGDTVVLVGQSTLKDGSRVAAENEAGEPVDTGAPPQATAENEIGGGASAGDEKPVASSTGS